MLIAIRAVQLYVNYWAHASYRKSQNTQRQESTQQTLVHW